MLKTAKRVYVHAIKLIKYLRPSTWCLASTVWNVCKFNRYGSEGGESEGFTGTVIFSDTVKLSMLVGMRTVLLDDQPQSRASSPTSQRRTRTPCIVHTIVLYFSFSSTRSLHYIPYVAAKVIKEGFRKNSETLPPPHPIRHSLISLASLLAKYRRISKRAGKTEQNIGMFAGNREIIRCTRLIFPHLCQHVNHFFSYIYQHVTYFRSVFSHVTQIWPHTGAKTEQNINDEPANVAAKYQSLTGKIGLCLPPCLPPPPPPSSFSHLHHSKHALAN